MSGDERIVNYNSMSARIKTGIASLLLLQSILSIANFANAQDAPLPYSLGTLPSVASDFDTHAQIRFARARAIDMPVRFSLAEDLPPIANQGGTGSCVGWSTAYYCYSSSIARQRKLSPEERKDPKFLFSPAFIWHQYNNGDKEKGMRIFQAFDVLEKQGCCTFAEMPWDEKDVLTQPDEKAKKRASKYKARQTVALFKGKLLGEDDVDPAKLRTWLWEVKKPFVMAIPVYQSFFKAPSDPNYVYDLPTDPGKNFGLHAVTVVGYDSDKKAFLMVNSWSEKWGNKGFLWLSEDFIKNNALEAWGQRPGGPVARDPKNAEVALTPNITLIPAVKANK